LILVQTDLFNKWSLHEEVIIVRTIYFPLYLPTLPLSFSIVFYRL